MSKTSGTERDISPIKWLITGGCGFIGTSLIRNLILEGGHRIRVLDNLTVGTTKDLSDVCEFQEIKVGRGFEKREHGDCELIVGDIRDEQLCVECTKDTDVIVHLAANTGVGPSVEDPVLDMEINVRGTFNMIQAARMNKVKRFVFASSGAPVGECKPPIHEELAPHPVSPYGASKLAGEGYCSAFYRTYGLETVALRFGNVYGPGSGHKNSVIAKFIKKAIIGEALEIYGDGTQTRDFIYIDDLIEAIRCAQSKHGVAGEIFQIATNKETSIEEMTEALIDALEKYGIRDIKMIRRKKRIGDVLRNYSDTRKAFKLLGWKSETDLFSGITKSIEWFLTKSEKK